jgi:hypothetical protein
MKKKKNEKDIKDELDKEKKREYERSYYALNADVICERKLKYYHKNKEKINKKRRIQRRFDKFLLKNIV